VLFMFMLHRLLLVIIFYFSRKISEYLQNAFSVIPSSVEKVVWNEYYLVKNNQRQSEPNWLGVLFQYPSLRWALLTAIAALLLFALLESRRRQKVIPAYSKPVNDSLNFVKTIGRLYYDKKDHKNLVSKMISFFWIMYVPNIS
jgi:hypothetical protein